MQLHARTFGIRNQVILLKECQAPENQGWDKVWILPTKYSTSGAQWPDTVYVECLNKC